MALQSAITALGVLRSVTPGYATSLKIIESARKGGVKLSEMGTDEEELRELRNMGSEASVRRLIKVLRRCPTDSNVREAIRTELRLGFIPPKRLKALGLEDLGIHVESILGEVAPA